MTTDNWQQFKDVFQRALELPREKRAAYLYGACGEPAARAELEALLLCYDSPPASAPEKEAKVDRTEQNMGAKTADDDSWVESFIDHYQIVAKLDDMGPATRYVALQLNDPALKQVALTLVRTKTNASDFLRSFNTERLALMNLQHPNIASLLDTGTTRDGVPYFVTSYIEGIPLAGYCDSNRLGTHARLKIFMDICDAIGYAHRRFIAHGGLTPKSILVTKDEVPKLLDLGLARLVHQEVRAQGMSADAADVEYRSDELIRGEPATAGDDVFSLGVLLYHLLAGNSPYRMKDVQGRTEKADSFLPPIFEPMKPSKILDPSSESVKAEKLRVTRKLLAGDLDSIILAAIEKDPSKRYSSVEALTEDLQRYFENRPVLARKHSFFYRATKFFSRHPFAVTAAAVLPLAMTAALILMLEGLLPR